jgi:redox-sensitive bicupin YhaK (pirin superfamily)
MAAAGYQGILSADVPAVDLPGGAGKARIIAGDYLGAKGPARSFTPINLWDLRLNRGADVALDLPDGHTAMVIVLDGHVTVEGEPLRDAEMALLDRAGSEVTLQSFGEATLLVLTGEPIDEPIVGHGPFVMNSQAEIRQAIDDFNKGRFARSRPDLSRGPAGDRDSLPSQSGPSPSGPSPSGRRAPAPSSNRGTPVRAEPQRAPERNPS